MLLFFLSIFVFSLNSFADGKKTSEIGLSMGTFLPNRLNDVRRSMNLYGFVIGIPTGDHQVQLQVSYGYERASVLIFESHYRLNLSTPILSAYCLGGVHLIRFDVNRVSNSYIGPSLGFGFRFPSIYAIELNTEMKIHFQDRPILGFGFGGNFKL